ncbi:MAG: PDZ domain-containing protein [Clostridia bacterium]|nr:PDZ domain-containing protein [Clostridia bacterium]
MFKKFLTVFIALVLSVTLCACTINIPVQPSTQSSSALIDTITSIIADYSYYDVSDEELAKMVVAAYSQAVGDDYAYYYTAEEFKELNESNVGNTQGIGISVIENTEYNCIEIMSVEPDSPALKAGLQRGDLVVAVGVGDNSEKVSELGFDMALKKLQGVAGTLCEFTVVRGENFGDPIPFSIMREAFVSSSVLFAKSKADSSVGIVKILQFNLTTPTQFCDAMESLIADGCTKFVYDLRDNPGGDLASVSAVLSRFYNEGDILIRTSSSIDPEKAQKTVSYCEAVNYGGDYSTCSVKKEDIAKYRNYPAAILINGYSASAAELFTAGMKDYGLATVVGETSYGKGCMQSIIDLSYYGLKGAMKLTTSFYFPPISDNYHGVGIVPDEGCEVVLSEEAAKLNPYSLLEENQAQDNQLARALEILKNK